MSLQLAGLDALVMCGHWREFRSRSLLEASRPSQLHPLRGHEGVGATHGPCRMSVIGNQRKRFAPRQIKRVYACNYLLLGPSASATM